MNQQLKRRINRMLGEAGFAQLDNAALNGQLAFMIDSHELFRSVLIAAEPEERRNAYEAIVPNLRFKPRTLDEYLTEAREDAEARQLPVQAEDGTLKPFQVPEIKTDAVDEKSR